MEAKNLKKNDILNGAYRQKDIIDIQCDKCGKPLKRHFKEYRRSALHAGSKRPAGQQLCVSCASKLGDKIAGAQANKRESARVKNREVQIRLRREHPEIGQQTSQSLKKFYKEHPEYHKIIAEKTSKGISNISIDSYIAMDCTSGDYYKKGMFVSERFNKKVHYSSSYELKALNIFETDSNVVYFDRALSKDRNKMLFIHYDGYHHYNPDFEVHYKNGVKKIIEVKAKWKLEDAQTKKKLAAGRKWADEHGYIFELWTQDELNIKNDWLHNDIEITDIKHFKYTGKVYDLTVENTHNYTVGRVSVHNSAAGSEVCYLTDIVKIDPIKNHLMFERFLNPSRFNYPDIDMDLAVTPYPAILEQMSQKEGN